MRTPDTSPRRLAECRFIAKMNDGVTINENPYWHVVTDLIAMVDAMEAQVRDLTKPEEEFHPVHLNAWAKTEPDPACHRCQGRGWYKKDVLGVEDAVVADAFYHCPLCDPLGKIPFALNIPTPRAADPTQP